MSTKKLIVVIACTVVASVGLSLGIVRLIPQEKLDNILPLGSGTQDRATGNAIGTPTASSTLTALFTGNSTVLSSKYMENLHLDIRYSPLTGQSNRYMEILIEESNDNGVNYYPISTKSVGTDNIGIYVTSTNGYTGIPLQIPGDRISVGSTTYHGTYDTDIMADHIRISARESGTASFGFAHIVTVMSAKQ